MGTATCQTAKAAPCMFNDESGVLDLVCERGKNAMIAGVTGEFKELYSRFLTLQRRWGAISETQNDSKGIARAAINADMTDNNEVR